MQEHQAFRVTAVLWAVYALATALPAVSYPSLLVPAIIRAGFALLIAGFFWFRPGRGIAIVGTILGLGSVPLALMAVTNLAAADSIFLLVAGLGLLLLIGSAYCWWLTSRRDAISN